MAWTAADLTAIEDAIASGEMEVRYEDKVVKYRSVEDLLVAREAVKQAVTTVTTIVPRQVRFQTSKGNLRTGSTS